MRWPIRFQFLVPMACLVVSALAAVSLWNGILAGQRTRQRIENDLQEVAQTLSDASFPLTDTVLRQVASLSGSEFIYCDARGDVLATSAPDLPIPHVASSDLLENASAVKLGPRIVIGTQGYYHTSLRIRGHAAAGSPAVLHMLYPQRDYQQAWWHAFFPPLLIGALAIVLVSLLGTAIASRVTRPLRALQAQVDEISRGNFRQLPEPARDDEVADLSRSVNRMAETLTLYENQVRHSEQLRTLGQLGSGIGHQMRNSVTGCRLAIQLHARECPSDDACESLTVAERQLDLMEQHVRRFLMSGRAAPTAHRRVDVRDVVESVVSLVHPTTRHLAVDVDWRRPAEAAMVSGHAEDLEQLLINLVLNAIEAASRLPTADTSTPQPATGARSPERSPNRPRVEICIRRDGDRILLDVADSGRGPAAELQATLFDAFISDKPEGTGLGLSIARQIAIDHQGELRWDRYDAMTRFTLNLPSMHEDR